MYLATFHTGSGEGGRGDTLVFFTRQSTLSSVTVKTGNQQSLVCNEVLLKKGTTPTPSQCKIIGGIKHPRKFYPPTPKLYGEVEIRELHQPLTMYNFPPPG